MGWGQGKGKGAQPPQGKGKGKGGGSQPPGAGKGGHPPGGKGEIPFKRPSKKDRDRLKQLGLWPPPKGQGKNAHQAHTRQRKGVTPDHPHPPPSDGGLQQQEAPQRAAAAHRAKRRPMQKHQLRSPPRNRRTQQSFDEPRPTNRGTSPSRAQPHLPRGERQALTPCQSSRNQPRSLAPKSRQERRHLFYLGLSWQTASTSRLTGFAVATTVTSGCLTSAQPYGWIASQPSRVPASWA